MKKHWKVEVWIDEELEGFGGDLLTKSNFDAVKEEIDEMWHGVKVVNYDVHEEKEVKMEKIGYKKGVIVAEHEETTDIVEIDKSRGGMIRSGNSNFKFDEKELYIAVRIGGPFSGWALNLSGKFEWILCKDVDDQICLVPLRKEKAVKKDE